MSNENLINTNDEYIISFDNVSKEEDLLNSAAADIKNSINTTAYTVTSYNPPNISTVSTTGSNITYPSTTNTTTTTNTYGNWLSSGGTITINNPNPWNSIQDDVTKVGINISDADKVTIKNGETEYKLSDILEQHDALILEIRRIREEVRKLRKSLKISE